MKFMKLRKRSTLLGIGVVALTVALAPQATAQLGNILKGAAIVVIVDKFGGQINSAINGLAGESNREAGNKTKVVPILSVGQGVSAGAAQISGPIKAVDSVQAVAQVEGNVKIGTSLRLKALIPVSTRSVKDSTRLKRVYGVGITGLVDVRL